MVAMSSGPRSTKLFKTWVTRQKHGASADITGITMSAKHGRIGVTTSAEWEREVSEVKVETNDTVDHLREYILTDGMLAEKEQAFPGQVHLISVRRYEARLRVDSQICTFFLVEDGDRRKYLITTPAHGFYAGRPAGIHALAWHRAAEALLAIRKGHMEYRRNRQIKTGQLLDATA